MSESLSKKCGKRVSLEGVSAVVPFFLLAAVIQSHWLDRLLTTAVCDSSAVNLTRCQEFLKFEVEEDNDNETYLEELREAQEIQVDLRNWRFYVTLGSTGAAMVSCLLVGLWTDKLGRRRIPLMLCCGVMKTVQLGLILCTIHSSSWIAPPWAVLLLATVANCASGPVVFTQLAFASLADSSSGAERLEEFVTLAALLATFKSLGGVISYVPTITGDKDYRSKSFAYALCFIFASIAIYRVYKHVESKKQSHHHSEHRRAPATVAQPKHRRLLISILFFCAAVFYFCYVAESEELMDLVRERAEMPDVRSSLYRVYGKVSRLYSYGGGIASGISSAIFFVLLRVRKGLHKKVVDQRFLKFFTAPINGAVGWAVEIVVKIVLSCTIEEWTLYIVMILSVFSELAICSVKFLLCSLVDSHRYGLVLGIAGIFEAIFPYLSSLSAYYIIGATAEWDENFVFSIYVFLLLLPLGIFTLWHFAQLSPMEEKKENWSGAEMSSMDD